MWRFGSLVYWVRVNFITTLTLKSLALFWNRTVYPTRFHRLSRLPDFWTHQLDLSINGLTEEKWWEICQLGAATISRWGEEGGHIYWPQGAVMLRGWLDPSRWMYAFRLQIMVVSFHFWGICMCSTKPKQSNLVNLFIAKSKGFPVGNSDEDQKSTTAGFWVSPNKHHPEAHFTDQKPEILVTEKNGQNRRWWRNVLPSWSNFVQKSLQTWWKRCIGWNPLKTDAVLDPWTAGFVNKCLKGQLWRVNKNGSFNHADLFIVKLGRGWCFFITTRNFKGGFRWFSWKILHCLVPGRDSWPTASARLNRVGAIFRFQQLDDFHIHRISSYVDISWSNYIHATSSWWNILARYIDLEIELTPERKLAQVVIKQCAQRSLSDLQF